MSRSRRKTPIVGVGGSDSEAWDKRVWHKRYRAMFRSAHDDDPIPPHINAAGQIWSMAKDGKVYIGGREDRPWYAKAMRK